MQHALQPVPVAHRAADRRGGTCAQVRDRRPDRDPRPPSRSPDPRAGAAAARRSASTRRTSVGMIARSALDEEMKHSRYIFNPASRIIPSGTVRKPESLFVYAHSQWRWIEIDDRAVLRDPARRSGRRASAARRDRPWRATCFDEPVVHLRIAVAGVVERLPCSPGGCRGCRRGLRARSTRARRPRTGPCRRGRATSRTPWNWIFTSKPASFAIACTTCATRCASDVVGVISVEGRIGHAGFLEERLGAIHVALRHRVRPSSTTSWWARPTGCRPIASPSMATCTIASRSRESSKASRTRGSLPARILLREVALGEVDRDALVADLDDLRRP